MKPTPENIILIGFMGSGKTSVGKLLAQKLNFDFLDLDEEIEKSTGLKIAEIFEIYGETYFRKIETEILSSLSNTVKSVISLGGGTFCTDENIKLTKALGTTFYLKASLDTLLSRYSREEREKRPLLKDLTKVENLLTQREAFYSQVDFIISTDNSSIENTVRLIINAWNTSS